MQAVYILDAFRPAIGDLGRALQAGMPVVFTAVKKEEKGSSRPEQPSGQR